MQSTLIKITLMNPNGLDQFTVEISDRESVLELKKLITNTHPSHPSVESQRLIFSGRYLV
jgi:hypothetical protein